MRTRIVRAAAGLTAALPTALWLAAAVGAPGPTAPLVWQGATEVATGRGERGPWRQNDSRYDYVDDPSVALDGRGDAAVVWVDQARKDVFFQRFPADGTRRLGAPVNVSRSPATFSWLPRVIVPPRAPQQVFVLWQEIIFSGGSHGGDILFARSTDGGATFSAPMNLSDSTGGDGKGRIDRDTWHNGSLDLALAADGTLHAAWTEYDGPLWVSRSVDGGATFSRPQRLAGQAPALPARAPSLAVGPDGALYLAWTTGEDAAADIHLASSVDGGATWDAPRVVAPSAGYSDAPRLAVDAGGTLHLVYAEHAGGPFEHARIRHTRSADGARTFEAPREISAPAPDPAGSAAFPALGIDAQGRVVVAWEQFADHRRRPRGLGVAVSRDGGQRFSPPVPVPDSRDSSGGSNGSHEGLLMRKLAVQPDGTIAIVNSSLKPPAHSRVWLLRARLAP